MKKHLFLLLILSVFSLPNYSQSNFKLIVLGSGGGINESNLSAYMISSSDDDKYICLDAGTLMHGLNLATNKGYFNHLQKSNQNEKLSAYVLHHHIDAYVISHPHLDHVMGMLIAAPFDNKKPIYCSPHTANTLMKNIFESDMWGNFTTEGEGAIGKWNIIRMQNEEWYSIPHNQLKIKSYPLCHSCPNEANAFLIQSHETYCLYFGDTGADEIEGKKRIDHIFQSIAPFIRQKKLKAIFIEVSFANKQANDKLYGHLKPSLLEKELYKLANYVNTQDINTSLQGIKIFITHIKPNFQINNNNRETIIEELKMIHKFGAEFIYPQQAEKYEF